MTDNSHRGRVERRTSEYSANFGDGVLSTSRSKSRSRSRSPCRPRNEYRQKQQSSNDSIRKKESSNSSVPSKEFMVQRRRTLKPHAAPLNCLLSNLQRSNARIDLIQEKASRDKLESLNKLLEIPAASIEDSCSKSGITTSRCQVERQVTKNMGKTELK